MLKRFASSSEAHGTAVEVLSTFAQSLELSITHWKGEEKPADGLTKSSKLLSLWNTLVDAVGLIPGPKEQGSNWIQNHIRMELKSDVDTLLALPFVASKKGRS